MKTLTRIAPVVLMALMISCGGGGPAGTTIIPEPPGGSTNLAGSFTPGEPNPGAGTVNMSEGSATSDDIVMVQVNVTGVDNLFGVDFSVVYNPSLAEYIGDYPGNIMESGGEAAIYTLSETQAGVITSGVAREGANAGGVNVTTTRPLVTLAFRVTGAGNSAVSFQNVVCFDADLETIQGISWAGGTLVAN